MLLDMKLLISFALLIGLVIVVKAVSNQQTNGKVKLGDPIPPVTAEDQDGKPINLAEAGEQRIYAGLFLSQSNDSRMYSSGLQPARRLF